MRRFGLEVTIDFYPRSPCGERQRYRMTLGDKVPFLSTFPLRGTSCHLLVLTSLRVVISIHVPLAGNVSATPRNPSRLLTFLSTFPLRGTSVPSRAPMPTSLSFLSTFPLRGTSSKVCASCCTSLISIHVPLAGHVCWAWATSSGTRDFYPRSPCGERRLRAARRGEKDHRFLSTFPLRGTSLGASVWANPAVGHFYPRSPCGERPGERLSGFEA